MLCDVIFGYGCSENLEPVLRWRQCQNFSQRPYMHTFLFERPVLRANRQGFHGLASVTCDCQIIHGSPWGRATQHVWPQAHMLVPECRQHIRNPNLPSICMSNPAIIRRMNIPLATLTHTARAICNQTIWISSVGRPNWMCTATDKLRDF
jgi:hypothetical protein